MKSVGEGFSKEQLADFCGVVALRCPALLRALDGSSWAQITVLAAWLISAVLLRHPESGQSLEALIRAFLPLVEEGYVKAAEEKPEEIAGLLASDTPFFPLPAAPAAPIIDIGQWRKAKTIQ